MSVSLTSRARYLVKRAVAFRPGRVWTIARQIAEEQHRFAPAVAVDMLWWAAFEDTAFIDYYEADFVLLSPAERRTFMTSLIQHHLADALNDREASKVLEDKLAFTRAFDEFLGREWLDLRETDAAGLETFAGRHPVIIVKVPVSREGKGVFRHDTADIDDWQAFYATLVAAGHLLVEEPIRQHPYLAEYCAGTVNTTRITTFFDGESVHPLVAVQKFGRGAVSDQFTWGGFFTMLDDEGRAVGPGHTGKKLSRYDTHPDSGRSIVQFQLPLWREALELVDRAARRIPAVPYIGWDVAITPDGPVLVEGNWTPGLYESRVSATGIRRGTRPRHEQAMRAGFPRRRRVGRR